LSYCRSRNCVAFVGGRGSGSARLREHCGVGQLPRSARADLGRHAWQGERTTDRLAMHSSSYGAVKTARVPRTAGAKGTMALTSRRWGTSRTHVEAGETAGARRAAQTSPAGCPARRRRSRARPRWFSAGQRDFDCVFLQKVE
jgi:hypothetical protein